MTVELSSLAKMCPRRRSASGSQPMGMVWGVKGRVSCQEVKGTRGVRAGLYAVVTVKRIPARLVR